jgi:hypothetical protein
MVSVACLSASDDFCSHPDLPKFSRAHDLLQFIFDTLRDTSVWPLFSHDSTDLEVVFFFIFGRKTSFVARGGRPLSRCVELAWLHSWKVRQNGENDGQMAARQAIGSSSTKNLALATLPATPKLRLQLRQYFSFSTTNVRSHSVSYCVTVANLIYILSLFWQNSVTAYKIYCSSQNNPKKNNWTVFQRFSCGKLIPKLLITQLMHC